MTTLDRLIDEAKSGKSAMESSVLPEGKLDRQTLAAAATYVRSHADHTAYHALMALRRDDPALYADVPADQVAQILCDALAQASFLNDWGYLDPDESTDGDAARALAAAGQAAVPCLTALLDDRRPAPLFGSEEATLSHMYAYRRADFAYRVLARILGEDAVFDAKPEARDRAIDQLRLRVG